MEEEDHAEFPSRFEFQENKSELDAHRVEDEKIVACERDVRIPNAGDEDGGEQKRSENAGPRLFQSKPQELMESGMSSGEGKQGFLDKCHGGARRSASNVNESPNYRKVHAV
jgi:hypothetical protein